MESKKTYGSPDIVWVAITEDVLTTSTDPIRDDYKWYVEGGMN